MTDETFPIRWNSISFGGSILPFCGMSVKCSDVLEKDACYQVRGLGESNVTFLMGKDAYSAFIRATTVWGPARLDPSFVHPKSKRKHIIRQGSNP